VTRDYLSNIDTAMLHLEDPTNLMMITGVMIFKSPIDFERLKATVEARLAGLRRFRQRLAWSRLGLGPPYWKDDPDFDLGYHVQRATLPPPGDQAALQDVVSLLASTPLDLTRPLWQFHLIENYAECCALVMRFHHSIGDGMALIHVILSLTDSDPDAAWPVVQPEVLQGDDASWPGAWGWPADLDRRIRRRAVGTLLREGFGLLAEPERVAELGRTGRYAAAELGRFLLHKPDPETVLKGELGVDKRAAWSTGIPLGAVKAIQQALGGTVNDVLLTDVSGAMRRYMQDRGDPVDHLTIRTAVPVNLRRAGSEGELGNRVGAIFVTLPVSIADPACRLSEIARRMNDQKDSLEAPAFYVALSALGQTPARMANALINTFSTRATVVMTNVRGPQKRLYLAGSPVEALLPWAPTTGRMGVAVSILSYAGEVRLGLLTDQGLVPDPKTIIDAFHAEFEALLARARSSAP
jgi:diacylglycerol O-acyltransferase